jgi:NitT/TauT family transport system substrate-binding protein
MSRSRRSVAAALAATLLTGALLGLAGCSRATDTPSGGGSAGGQAAPAPQGPAAELRLGYFPNVTHSAAIIGVDKGFIAGELGNTKLTPQIFNAGGEAVTALLGGSLDATFIGSGPAINAYVKSNGGVRVISGANNGGAQLVVRPSITTPEQLRGKVIAVPQLGNTQDIALRKWLKELKLDQGPDKVIIAAMENARTLDSYKQNAVDGGWLPEPWASRLADAGATVLLDEKTRWPDGQFPTTVLIVRAEYAAQHPETVAALIRGNLKALDYIAANPDQAKVEVNNAVEKITGKKLTDPVLKRAFSNITPSYDPLAGTFAQLAQDSLDAATVEQKPDVQGLFDLSALNAALQAAGKPAVDAAGLDKPRG